MDSEYIDQPVENESKPIAKVIISATALIASFTAGTAIDNEQIKTLQDDNQAKIEQIDTLTQEKDIAVTERDTAIEQKKDLTTLYAYNQARLNDNTVDGSVVSLNDFQESYVKILNNAGIEIDVKQPVNLFEEVKKAVIINGDTICNI